jgi:hypothetical protein
MIEVPFKVEAYEVDNTNPLNSWIQRNWNMPWLNYLLENNQGIETERFYDAPTHSYTVIFKFNLDPKKETYYRLKYNS